MGTIQATGTRRCRPRRSRSTSWIACSTSRWCRERNGTLDVAKFGLPPARMREMVALAPCAFLVVGGGGASAGFRTAPTATLAANIVRLVDDFGYDGVDSRSGSQLPLVTKGVSWRCWRRWAVASGPASSRSRSAIRTRRTIRGTIRRCSQLRCPTSIGCI